MTDNEIKRAEMYRTKYKMDDVAAEWAATHENMPEFRELTFVTDNYTILPHNPHRRTTEDFDERPYPGWLNPKLVKETIRLYWEENLTAGDCSYYLKESEQETKERIRDIRAWYASEKILHCKKCSKAFDKAHLANDTMCFACFTKKVGKLYK